MARKKAPIRKTLSKMKPKVVVNAGKKVKSKVGKVASKVGKKVAPKLTKKIMHKQAVKKQLKAAGIKTIPKALMPPLIPLLPVIFKMNSKAGFHSKKPYLAVAFFHEYFIKGNKDAINKIPQSVVDDILTVIKAVINFIKNISARKKKGEQLSASEEEVLKTAEETVTPESAANADKAAEVIDDATVEAGEEPEVDVAPKKKGRKGKKSKGGFWAFLRSLFGR